MQPHTGIVLVGTDELAWLVSGRRKYRGHRRRIPPALHGTMRSKFKSL